MLYVSFFVLAFFFRRAFAEGTKKLSLYSWPLVSNLAAPWTFSIILRLQKHEIFKIDASSFLIKETNEGIFTG